MHIIRFKLPCNTAQSYDSSRHKSKYVFDCQPCLRRLISVCKQSLAPDTISSLQTSLCLCYFYFVCFFRRLINWYSMWEKSSANVHIIDGFASQLLSRCVSICIEKRWKHVHTNTGKILIRTTPQPMFDWISIHAIEYNAKPENKRSETVMALCIQIVG